MSTWGKTTKSASPTWGKVSKNVSSWSKSTKTLVNQFLLLETGGFLLLETGGKIILNQSVPTVTWNKVNKS